MRNDLIYEPIDPTRRLRVKEALFKLTVSRTRFMKRAKMSRVIWYRALKTGLVSERTFLRIEDVVFSELRAFTMRTRLPRRWRQL